MLNKCSFLLILAVLFLFSIGLLTVFNTTSASALDRSLISSTHNAFLRQIVYGILGILFGFFFYWIGFQKMIRMSGFFLGLTTLFLLLVFLPHIGLEINGARRWISIFGFSFQPSECAKYLIPMYFIYRITQLKGGISLKDFLQLGVLLFLPVALILLEPDNGTTAIILVSLIVLFVLSKIRWTYWVLPVFFLMVLGGIAAYHMPHVPDRIRVYLHPELDLRGKGHQPHQAKIAAGAGGLWGRGLGESLQKLNYLPEARSDYIAAIFAEEFGFAGVIALIGLYMIIAYAGFSIAFRAKDKRGFYLAALLTFLFSFQAFLNLGVVSTLLPSKGTTLPFFSLGGTSLIVNFIALFLLINIESESKKRVGLWTKNQSLIERANCIF